MTPSQKRHAIPVWMLACLLGMVFQNVSHAQPVEAQIAEQLDQIEFGLIRWDIAGAKKQVESLLHARSEDPRVQRLAAWVKYHLGDHGQAKTLFDEASVEMESHEPWNSRYSMVRAAAELSRNWRRVVSRDDRVIVQYGNEIDGIMVPYLIDAIERTLQVVGKDLGFIPNYPIVVEILDNEAELSALAGLSVDQIRTSGTIAVCKYGRLMIISPRATLKGYGWLDTASHELVHRIISEKTHNKTPVWLHEALARFEDRRWRSDEPLYRKSINPLEENLLAQALTDGSWIRFDRISHSIALLDSEKQAALAFAELFMVASFLHSQKGYAGLRTMLDGITEGKSAFDAIEDTFGIKKADFIQAWLNWTRDTSLKKLKGEPELERRLSRSKPGSSRRKNNQSSETALRDHFHLGQLLRARGRHQASAAEFYKAVDLAGSDHAALWLITNKLGLALMEMGQTESAKRAFEKGLTINPDDLEAHLHLCGLMLSQEPYRAWYHCREAFRVNPLDPRVHASSHQVAEMLLKQGNNRENWTVHIQRHRRAFRLLSNQAVEKTSDLPKKSVQGESAYIKIITKPWAQVWIDYQDTGLTTPVYKLALSPGVHLVGLVVGCEKQPEVVRVRLTEGQTVVVERELCKSET